MNAASKWAIGALLPLAVGTAGCGRESPPPETRSPLALLDAIGDALEGYCRFEPEFTGGIGGCACDPDPDPLALVPKPQCRPVPPPGSAVFARLVRLKRDAERVATGRSAEALRVRAVWRLIWSDSAAAAEATSSDLDVAEPGAQAGLDWLSDRIAARLIHASRSGSPRRLVEARELALAAAGSLPSTALGRNREISEAWMRGRAMPLIDADTSGAGRCSDLRSPLLAALRASPPGTEAGRDDPTDEAGTLALRRRADELSEACKDSFFRDLLAELGDSDGKMSRLGARRIADFSQGVSAYARYDLVTTRHRFEHVIEMGSERSDLLAAWATLFLSATDYQEGASAPARAKLLALTRGVGFRHPWIAARWHWQMGSLDESDSRLLEAVRHYEESIRLYRSVGDRDGSLPVAAILAGVHWQYGELDSAWKILLPAIRGVQEIEDPRRRLNVLFTAARVSEATGAIRVATEFAARGSRTIAGANQDLAQLTILRTRARLELLAGRKREADDLRGEMALIEKRLPPGASSELFEAATIVDLYEAMPSPYLAERALETALSKFRVEGLRLEEARARWALARLRSASAERALSDTETYDLLNDFSDMLARMNARERRLAVHSLSPLIETLESKLIQEARFDIALEVDQWSRLRRVMGADLESRSLRGLLTEIAERASRSGSRIVVFRFVGPHLVRWSTNERGSWDSTVFEVAEHDILEALAALEVHYRSDRDPATSMVVERLTDLFRLYEDTGPRAERGLLVLPDGPLWSVPLDLVGREVEGPVGGEPRASNVALAFSLPYPASTGEVGSRAGIGVVGYPVGLEAHGYPRLDAEGRELTTLEAAFPRRVSKAIGEQARPDLAKLLLRSVEIAHFVAHTVEPREAEVGSRILLTSTGTEGAPGLSEDEIRTLDLTGLRLVMLATCRSALGVGNREVAAGGLAEAFLAAGADAVISSLWQIDDRVATDFAGRFYRELAAGASIESAFHSARRAAGAGAGQSDSKRRDAAALVLIHRFAPVGAGAGRVVSFDTVPTRATAGSSGPESQVN